MTSWVSCPGTGTPRDRFDPSRSSPFKTPAAAEKPVGEGGEICAIDGAECDERPFSQRPRLCAVIVLITNISTTYAKRRIKSLHSDG